MSVEVLEQTPRVVVEPLQWSRLQMIEEVRPIEDADYEVLKDVREVLLRHGYQDRFGVCLLHKHFDLKPGEAALGGC